MRTQRITPRALLLTLVGAVVGFALTHPRRAEAVWRQHAATSCVQDSGAVVTTVGELGNYSLTDRMTLRCPIVDGDGATGDDTFLKEDVATVNVYYTDSNDDSISGSVVVKACISYVAGGGACGTSDSSSTTGTGTSVLTPPTSSVWTSGTVDDFGYLHVDLPPIKSAGESTLRGYYIST